MPTPHPCIDTIMPVRAHRTILIVQLALALLVGGMLPPEHLHHASRTHPQVVHSHWPACVPLSLDAPTLRAGLRRRRQGRGLTRRPDDESCTRAALVRTRTRARDGAGGPDHVVFRHDCHASEPQASESSCASIHRFARATCLLAASRFSRSDWSWCLVRGRRMRHVLSLCVFLSSAWLAVPAAGPTSAH